MLQTSPKELWERRSGAAAPLWSAAPSGGDVLCAMPARWIWDPQGAPQGPPEPGPRHRTLRRRGVAPAYPAPAELENALKGRLEARPQGLRLLAETGAARLDLPSGVIAVRVFHRDAAELHLASGARVLIGLAERDAELLDVVTQAYF